MKLKINKPFFAVSPWLLAGSTTLLVLIVLTFTLSNMQREKDLMTSAMLQKAATLMRVLKSGARASYLADLRHGFWNMETWDRYVQRAIFHLAEDPEVEYLAVVDREGIVIAHSSSELVGTTMSFTPELQRNPGDPDAPALVYRIVQSGENGRIFLAVRPFYPFRPPWSMMRFGMDNNLFADPDGPNLLPDQPDIWHHPAPAGTGEGPFYVLVGLDMHGFDTALGKLRFQAIVLSLVMLLVGLGGWFSLAMVQGYRVSQKALGEIQAFTSLLVARLPVGIIATDRVHRVTTWNSAAAEMTGIPADKTLGRPLFPVLPEGLRTFFKGDGPEDTSVPVSGIRELTLDVDGRKMILLVQKMHIHDQENRPGGEVLLLSDLTEIKGLEQKMRENERLAAVGRMAAGVAHEVRNPLSSVKGLALLLRGTFSPHSRERETADLLIQEVERMNRTISELLSFSRPESLDLTEVRIDEILARTLQLIEADTDREKIRLHLEVQDNLPLVMADPDRLNQVFINIFLNAIQAMEDGGVLDVSAVRQPGGDTVLVTVRDSGCGMDSKTLEQIFFPYFTTKEGGTGIGLAISQKIISDHGGSLRIESEVGRGTTVFIELPIWNKAQGRPR